MRDYLTVAVQYKAKNCKAKRPHKIRFIIVYQKNSFQVPKIWNLMLNKLSFATINMLYLYEKYS